MTSGTDPFGARTTLKTRSGAQVTYYQLNKLANLGGAIDRLPYTVKVLLESQLRRCGDGIVDEQHVKSLATWQGQPVAGAEFPFTPARVLLQDLTGVPAIVDLAAMRAAVARLGGDPLKINPLVQCDLVIDHSVQIDRFGTKFAMAENVEREYARNGERYQLLRWAGQAFQNYRVVPPGYGICHQVNLEYLASVVYTKTENGVTTAYPDTLVGTDSHTTMVNGLGVVGWGVGGIEAEAMMLGQPMYLLSPDVVGMKLSGDLPEGATATDLVLVVTQMLRKFGVVGRFVEFYGAGVSQLSAADRATISNMAPEYGATASTFPVDAETLNYLRTTGRDADAIELVEAYCKEQGMFHIPTSPDPMFTATLELDLSTVEPSLAGPRRPQDRVALKNLKQGFRAAFPSQFGQNGAAKTVGIDRFTYDGGPTGKPVIPLATGGQTNTVAATAVEEPAVTADHIDLTHGSVAIAAITSCTNTSNPSVMIGAGLLAKRAHEKGLTVKPFVKTSLAPGSRAVSEYLRDAGLLEHLEALRFHVVGYGCTTCIGNSGPLAESINQAVRQNDLVVAAVLSGNRNFEGRIHALVKASFLASPPLVVAYALAGTVDINLNEEPLGTGKDGQPVYLRDIWPSPTEVAAVVSKVVRPAVFAEAKATLFEGDERWQSLPVPTGPLYEFDQYSTYVQEPPYFQDMAPTPAEPTDIVGARALGLFGDSITTDHISPAGSIQPDGPAGRFLVLNDVNQRDFNSFGARRGNHEVMMRGTFANVRLRNELTPDKEGDWAIDWTTGETARIFYASQNAIKAGIPLCVIAGKEYGTGSSRDWAAKGPNLLGIKFAIAESFERIHRSNLVGMGVLPLQFKAGDSRQSLGLTGRETFAVEGISQGLAPLKTLTVRARREDGSTITFLVTARIDTPVEVDYYRHGGILQMVLRNLMAS